MVNNNYFNCHVLPLEVYTFVNMPSPNSDIQGTVIGSSTARYLQFIDNIKGVVKRGGMQRRSVQPTLGELQALERGKRQT